MLRSPFLAVLVLLSVSVLLAASCSDPVDPPKDAGPMCVAADCSAMGFECGTVPDGKGGCLDCGRCTLPLRCGGGGDRNRCGCTPQTCATLNARCGDVPDQCGGTLQCGGCTLPDTCGGAGRPNVCGRIVGPGEACDDSGAIGCQSGYGCCSAAFGAMVCTPLSNGGCPGPGADLVPQEREFRQSVTVETATFAADYCGIVEGCVGAEGTRRLVRFRTMVANLGTADLNLGDPNVSPLFRYSPCFQRLHLDGFAEYKLLDMNGAVVATGHKAGFCMEDNEKISPAAPDMPKFSCWTGVIQGIQMGWADDYNPELDCQWVDVTGVPSGRYRLEVHINPGMRMPEIRHDNNVMTATVTL